MKAFSFLGIVFCSLVLLLPSAQAHEPGVGKLKKQILRLARSYKGKADPDQSLQKNLDKLVDQLVAKASMPSVEERLPLLAGVWKQVWGPYDYRNDEGGIDPTLGWREIYQVIFADGYYYNVAPYYPNGDKTKEQIGYLRGEYELDPQQPNGLRVRFTKYPGVKTRPKGIAIWELPALSEAGKVEEEIAIVPTPVVEQFFSGGTLDEVYTDHNLRIVYGTSYRPNARRFLYVMRRIE